MKFLASLALVAATVSFGELYVEAGTTHIKGVHIHHRDAAAHLSGSAARLARRQASGKCHAHFSQLYSSSASTKPSSTSSSKAHSTSTHTSTHTTTSSTSTSTHTTSSTSHTTSSSSNHANKLAATPTGNAGAKTDDSDNGPATHNGLIKVTSAQCGDSGATLDITHNSGPNGAQAWLNCGVTGSGWKPPHVEVGDLKVVSLSQSIQSSNSPFQPCSAFVNIFYQYAGEFGLPPILLAGIAMQESSCNPATVGGAGEQGLMQLTHDKCGGAPGGDCKEPHFNIRTGAAFFSSLIQQNGGNVLLSMGQYNGWEPGLTVGSATAIEPKCCRCQNNLDYLQQYFNGWMQGVNPYQLNMGTFHNLDACPSG